MCSGLALVALLRRKSGDSEGDTEQPRPTIFRAPQVCGAEEYRDVGCKAAGKAYSVLRNAHVNMPEIDMGAAWQPRQVSASAFIRYCLWLASHSRKQYISRIFDFYRARFAPPPVQSCAVLFYSDGMELEQ